MDSGKSDNLTAAFIEHTAVIRVERRGSFKISTPLKQFIHHVVDTHSASRIWLDMSDCTGMDSTFMGVVAGLACLIKSRSSFSFKLLNLSEKNQKLLTTLGVDRVVDYSMTATDEEKSILSRQEKEAEPLEPDSASKLEAAETTLEAHKTLVDINPENLPKFKSVLEFLREDVHNLHQE